MPIIIDSIALAVIYLRLFRRWRGKGKDQLLINSLMYIYLCFVLYFTLMPIIVSLPFIFNHPYTPMNMQPFSDLLSGRGDYLRQIILNIIMTIPFGLLLPLIKKQTLLSCALYTLLLSLLIEMLQPLINGSRSADITDLITNTLGGIIGFLLFRLSAPLTKALLQRLRRTA